VSKYLLGRKYTNDPWFEVYEANGPSVPPEMVNFRPPVSGPVQNVGFNDAQDIMVTVTNTKREEMPGLGSGTDTTAAASKIWFSPDEYFVITSAPPALYKRQGPFYVPVPEADFPLGDMTGITINTATISEEANVITLTLSNQPNKVRVYDRNEGTETWDLDVTDLLGTVTWGTVGELTITPDSQLIFVRYAVGPQSVYRLVDEEYVPIGLASPNLLQDWIELPNGKWRLAFENGGDPGSNLTIYDLDPDDGTYVAAGVVPADAYRATTGASYMQVRFGHHGETLFYIMFKTLLGTESGRFLRGYYFPGSNTTWTVINGLDGGFNVNTLKPTGGQALAFNSTGAQLAATVQFSTNTVVASRWLMVFNIVKTGSVYSASLYSQVNFATTRFVQTYSPDDTIIHMNNEHRSAVAPLAVVTSLDVAPGGAASNVSRVTYSPSGGMSWANTSFATNPIFMVKDGKGDYLNFKTLEGTFVNTYDRKDPGFVERKTFIQHIEDTKITDIIFSPSSDILSYHGSRDGDVDQSGVGRYVYDLTEENKVKQRGVLGKAGDERSLADIDEDSNYMVVSYRNPAGSDLRLYSLQETVPDPLDIDVVPYGPVAFSKCDTVTVSHGGNPPYSLFDHLYTPTDRLEKRNLPPMDLTIDSTILAAFMTEDCNGLVIVTPDKVIIIDPNTGEELDEEEIDVPDNPDFPPDIQPDPDGSDDTTIVPVYDDTVNPGDPVTTPGSTTTVDGDGKTVSNINYIPYVAINITYRTR
jgi:hypothetical protein